METVDLILVERIDSIYPNAFLYKAPPAMINVNDLVRTREKYTKSIAKVIEVCRNIDTKSHEYKFICQVTGVKDIEWIYSILKEEPIIIDYTCTNDSK